MDSYKIEWKRSAVKELRSLPKDAVLKIVEAVEQLSTNPYPAGVKKLIGAQHTYRIREGSYRVIFTVVASSLVIEVIRVGHRKDVYDR
jgi:mRNA interferase RelE/StbE